MIQNEVGWLKIQPTSVEQNENELLREGRETRFIDFRKSVKERFFRLGFSLSLFDSIVRFCNRSHTDPLPTALSARECLYRLDGMLLQARRGYYKRGLESNSKHNEAIQTRPGCRSFSFGICPHCSRFQCERAPLSRINYSSARAYSYSSRVLFSRPHRAR